MTTKAPINSIGNFDGGEVLGDEVGCGIGWVGGCVGIWKFCESIQEV